MRWFWISTPTYQAPTHPLRLFTKWLTNRCILWARIAIVPVFICHAIQLDLDLTFFFDQIMLPSLSVVRPAVGLVVCFLSFFINSHFALRWFVVIMQPLFVVASLFTAASMRVLIGCREAGTCLVKGGISLQQLQLYENIQYTEAFFAVCCLVIGFTWTSFACLPYIFAADFLCLSCSCGSFYSCHIY